MEGMGNLKVMADSILRKLEAGELPVQPSAPAPTSTATTTSSRAARSSFPKPVNTERRRAIMREILDRYTHDRQLEPHTDLELAALAESYDELFTRAGIPTDRLRDVYLEAMAHHGDYKLKVDDYLRAWQRLCARSEGHADDVVRGAQCKACGGTGSMWKFKPYDWRNPDLGQQVEVDCPYRCPKTVALARVVQSA